MIDFSVVLGVCFVCSFIVLILVCDSTSYHHVILSLNVRNKVKCQFYKL